MNEKKQRDEKIKEIRGRLDEFLKHKNDPYAYYPEEIDAVREIRNKAPEDIKALLDIIDKLETEIKRLENLLKNQIVD